MNYSFSDSIVAIATSLNFQALSIIRASGKGCLEILASVFSAPERILGAKGSTTHMGYIMRENEKIDQVVVSIYRAPHSFTGEDSIEITSHGSPYITLEIYNLLLKKGLRAAERGEFSFRAFVNGKINLTQAEAVKLLSSAKTEKEAKLAISQLDNALFNKIEKIKQNAINLMAMLDVALEYPEDEVPLDEASFKFALDEILKDINALLKRWKNDALFIEGVKVVIAGRANAGKSSLFNALLNEERSIVSSIAGTTRDYIDGFVKFRDLPIKLYDTAGMRHTKDKIEAEGLNRTQKIIDSSQLVLYLIDDSEDGMNENIAFLKECNAPFIVIFTKKDIKAPYESSYKILNEAGIEGERIINISVKNGDGIDELIDVAYHILVKDQDIENNDEAIICERQKNLLEKAKEHFQYITKHYICAKNFEYMDLIMQDVQDGLHALGEITGEVRADDILSSIFSSFCVGK